MVKSQTRLSHVSLDCIHALVGTVKLYNGRCLPCSLLLTPVCFFLYFQSNNCQQCQKYRSIILSQDVELILVFYKSTMERSLCTQDTADTHTQTHKQVRPLPQSRVPHRRLINHYRLTMELSLMHIQNKNLTMEVQRTVKSYYVFEMKVKVTHCPEKQCRSSRFKWCRALRGDFWHSLKGS